MAAGEPDPDVPKDTTRINSSSLEQRLGYSPHFSARRGDEANTSENSAPLVIMGPSGTEMFLGVPPKQGIERRQAIDRSTGLESRSLAIIGLPPSTSHQQRSISGAGDAAASPQPPRSSSIARKAGYAAYRKHFLVLVGFVLLNIIFTWSIGGNTPENPTRGVDPPPFPLFDSSLPGENGLELPYGNMQLSMDHPSVSPPSSTRILVHIYVPFTFGVLLVFFASIGSYIALQITSTLLLVWVIVAPITAPSLLWGTRFLLDIFCVFAASQMAAHIGPSWKVVRKRQLCLLL